MTEVKDLKTALVRRCTAIATVGEKILCGDAKPSGRVVFKGQVESPYLTGVVLDGEKRLIGNAYLFWSAVGRTAPASEEAAKLLSREDVARFILSMPGVLTNPDYWIVKRTYVPASFRLRTKDGEKNIYVLKKPLLSNQLKVYLYKMRFAVCENVRSGKILTGSPDLIERALAALLSYPFYTWIEKRVTVYDNIECTYMDLYALLDSEEVENHFNKS